MTKMKRLIPNYLPRWYILYFGDFLWAMSVFFLYGLILRSPTQHTFCIALISAYLIERSQVVRPDLLEYLRSIRPFSFLLDFGFLWSDLIAYTLAISLAAGINRLILTPKKNAPMSNLKTFPFRLRKSSKFIEEKIVLQNFPCLKVDHRSILACGLIFFIAVF
ncbi:MAG: DUF2809 domain-containing protein [Candidatus Electrothrix sp. AR4]|nr:DUF2809 domain-containing protein [Candidatus Electrothrix sp. AR4]